MQKAHAMLGRYRAPRRYSRMSRQRMAFISEFLRNGGKGVDAALHARYSASSAAVTATRLLRDDRVLALIAAEVTRRPGDYGAAKAAKKLLRESRPKHLRVRFRMLLAGGGLAKKIETPGGVAVVMDPAETSMRDYAASRAIVEDARSLAPDGGVDPFAN